MKPAHALRLRTATVAGPATDPHYANVVAHLPMQSLNGGSTGPLDIKGNTWTFAGNAQLDNSDSVFGAGGYSLLLDGTGDYISAPDATGFDFGTNAFSVEFWFKASNLASSPFAWHQLDSSSSANAGWFIEPSTAGIYAGKGVATINTDFALFPATLLNNTWYWLQMIRSGNNLTVGVGGASLGTFAPGGSGIAGNYDKTTPVVAGGGGGTYFTALMMNGRKQDLRITKGVARALFLPTAPLPTS